MSAGRRRLISGAGNDDIFNDRSVAELYPNSDLIHCAIGQRVLAPFFIRILFGNEVNNEFASVP